jgi:hypothetical protein
LFLYLHDRYAKSPNPNCDDGRPEHGLDTQSLISARNVKTNEERDDFCLGAQGVVIWMNGNQGISPNGSMSHASSISFLEEAGSTQEIMEAARAEWENILAVQFPFVDRARILSDIILSLQHYPHPEAPISRDEDDHDDKDDSGEDKAFGLDT